MWSIDRTAQVSEWITGLDEDAKEAIFQSLLILREIGPNFSVAVGLALREIASQ